MAGRRARRRHLGKTGRRSSKERSSLAVGASRTVLLEAQALLERLLPLLNDPVCEEHVMAAVSFAYARAHTLRMLDQLSRMTASR